jgi:hypothetical protein
MARFLLAFVSFSCDFRAAPLALAFVESILAVSCRVVVCLLSVILSCVFFVFWLSLICGCGDVLLPVVLPGPQLFLITRLWWFPVYWR